MSRKIGPAQTWPAERVETYAVAPHRYRYDAFDESYRDGTFKQFAAGIPYKTGDVIWLKQYHGRPPVRAYVLSWGTKRDRYGDRREYYNVLVETKRGHWSKSWIRAHPGPIQRGYAIAGLAPDVPMEAR
jgi:hypothetical protein